MAATPATPAAPAVSVVVGVDGSPTSWDAFSWACGEARRLRARLVAVYVSAEVEEQAALLQTTAAAFNVPVCDGDELYTTAIERAETLQATARRELDDNGGGIELCFVHAWGDPTRELLRATEAVGADLLVVGRSTKVRHQIAGSLGRSLVGRRRAPVVVVVP